MIGKLAAAGIARDVALGHVGERADDDVAAVIRQQLRCHGLQAPAEEQVQKEGLDDVVAVVAEGDLGDAVLGGDSGTARRGAGASTARTSCGLPASRA